VFCLNRNAWKQFLIEILKKNWWLHFEIFAEDSLLSSFCLVLYNEFFKDCLTHCYRVNSETTDPSGQIIHYLTPEHHHNNCIWLKKFSRFCRKLVLPL
jgi:hypothetical protein